MNTRQVKYLAFYDSWDSMENRGISPAAINKTNYICSAMVKAGYNVKIISPAFTKKTSGYYNSSETEIEPGIKLLRCPTFGTNNKLQKIIRFLYTWLWLFFYILFNVKRDEEILVYHSLFFAQLIFLAKKIKKFKLILEVNEIYQDVIGYSQFYKESEMKIINVADKYILSTELLKERINVKNKPCIINHGTYKVEREIMKKYDDNKIHIVYAGIIDMDKGGAAAINSALYLDENYRIHIIGFGRESDILEMHKQIKQVNDSSECKVTYDGMLSGENYVQFIQKCHIGYSTQNSNGKYNETSFPSKILSYLSNGLRVVSVRIKSIEKSEIGTTLYYYNSDDPQDIARTVKQIDFNQDYDSRELVKKLDTRFVNDLKKIMLVGN